MERTKGQKGWCRGLGEDWTYSDAACEHKEPPQCTPAVRSELTAGRLGSYAGLLAPGVRTQTNAAALRPRHSLSRVTRPAWRPWAGILTTEGKPLKTQTLKGCPVSPF